MLNIQYRMLNVEVTRGASHRGDKSPERQITRSTNGLVGGLPSTVHSQPSTVNGLGGSRRWTVDSGRSQTAANGLKMDGQSILPSFAKASAGEHSSYSNANRQINKSPDRKMIFFPSCANFFVCTIHSAPSRPYFDMTIC